MWGLNGDLGDKTGDTSMLDDLLAQDGWNDLGNGLKVKDDEVGNGAECKKGDVIVAHYSLYLTSGTLLQTSVGGQPFSTQVGVGNLIKGWDIGIPGMKEGGWRKLIIPPDLAYGKHPPQGIPPNATLIFEVQLVSIQ